MQVPPPVHLHCPEPLPKNITCEGEEKAGDNSAASGTATAGTGQLKVLGNGQDDPRRLPHNPAGLLRLCPLPLRQGGDIVFRRFGEIPDLFLLCTFFWCLLIQANFSMPFHVYFAVCLLHGLRGPRILLRLHRRQSKVVGGSSSFVF